MKKNEKGVTLVTLVLTVIVILIITSMVIYKSRESVSVRNIENLYNDISELQSNINDYYDEYGKLPAIFKCRNTSNLNNILNDYEKNSDFYVVDLDNLKGITLNYGKEYKEIKSEKDVINYTDIYIVNSVTHNVFYVEGVKIGDKKYYTNYTTPDNTVIDLRYIDGVLIPNDYFFEKKDEKERIIIKGPTRSGTNEYVWVKQLAGMDNFPSSIDISNKSEQQKFLNSVNKRKGYFVKLGDENKSSGKKVVYI